MASPQVRRCHWLRQNRTSQRPDAIIFLDAEADIARPHARRQDHTFRLASACYTVYEPFPGLVERDWQDFRSVGDLWAWIDQITLAHEKTLVVAHNIDYDARLTEAFSLLPRLGWTPSFCVMSPSCNVFDFAREKHKLTLLDNLNLFRAPLADLGKSVGVEKLSVDFETAPDEELAIYCRRDVRILVETWRQWLDFLDRYDLGSFGITIAKQAHNAYRHRFMACQIGIHGNAEALALERASYRGGRSECFFVGDLPPGRYYKVDVNGLYSAMMSWYTYPRRLVKVVQNVDASYLGVLLRDYLAIAEVVVDVREPRFPVHVSGRNVYPLGSYITTLTTPELQIALLHGEVKGIGRVALYEPADLFSGYIDFLTPLRQEYKAQGDRARSKMCKLLRNALQGKFGQRGHKQKAVGTAPLDVVKLRHWVNSETGESATDLTFGGVVLRQWIEGEAFDSFPAIPAHVSAYGRVYMWSLMLQAGRENVYYIDTDGLIVNREGLLRLRGVMHPYELGKLKVEGVAESVTVRARKDYRFGQREVVKGIRETADRLSPDVYDQWHFTTLRYAFRTQDLDGVTLHRARKELKRGIVAGHVLADGWVRPPRVSVKPEKLYHLDPTPPSAKWWVWEFDRSWLEKLDRSHSLQWRLAHSLKWEASPLLPGPLPLQPLGSASRPRAAASSPL